MVLLDIIFNRSDKMYGPKGCKMHVQYYNNIDKYQVVQLTNMTTHLIGDLLNQKDIERTIMKGCEVTILSSNDKINDWIYREYLEQRKGMYNG
tara:strand:+ start:265 stop:543 length:279 start_codon:yes stop_codon:yes gene_type:complete